MTNIGSVTFHGNHESTSTLDHLCHHIINQSVLIPYPFRLEVLPVLAFVYLLEDIFESPIVLFEDCVLGTQVQR